MWHQDLFNTLILSPMTVLAKSLHALNYKRFILTFDECGELNMNKLGGSPQLPSKKMSLIALQRIIKAQPSDVRFWSLLWIQTRRYPSWLLPAPSLLPFASRITSDRCLSGCILDLIRWWRGKNHGRQERQIAF